ncbi:N-succinylarginine dihydrolase [Polymorphobacter sp.]|uniref:N-succinylarginine dihydrolase n=1 Tax=Polymorphobacter sp. TaxID=1909290 RepID=UPI003F726B71
MKEINVDGLIGPTHNYAALSPGNIASQSNAGRVSRPRAAALQGLEKMRFVMRLGLPQAFLLPHERPHLPTLRALGFAGTDDQVCAAAWDADPSLFAQAMSASAMWTANAATVSAAPDTADGSIHLSVANLSRMPHRSHEPLDTEAQLRLAFAHPNFHIHPALPAAYGDEGAANHMRLAPHHDGPGLEIYVYGEDGGRFPARQSRRASEAIARRHGVANTLFIQQSPAAIDAGAFHNDVVAVANGPVLFSHEQAFATAPDLPAWARWIEVPAATVPLADAISSYLFNSQLLTLPDGSMALIVPDECRTTPSVANYLQMLINGDTPIRHLHIVNVRESMRNGGGPACLRLRVVADPNHIDPRFRLSEARADALHQLIETRWPEQISPADLGTPDLWHHARTSRAELLKLLEIKPPAD